jgi:hypothetical protein
MQHKDKVYDAIGADLSQKMIALNPDFYTLLNYRRLLLESLFAKEGLRSCFQMNAHTHNVIIHYH